MARPKVVEILGPASKKAGEAGTSHFVPSEYEATLLRR